MIDPYKVYDPRKNKILPFYECKKKWDQEIKNWLNNFSNEPSNYDHNDIDDFCYSAFSRESHISYNQIVNKKTNIELFHKEIGIALELHLKGKYILAKEHIIEALKTRDKENRLQLYALQLSKNNQLLLSLRKIKSNNRKIRYLNTKYFEISGNIFYSCDLLGTNLLLKLLSNKTNISWINQLSIIINRIYQKTKNFKGNMTLFSTDIIKNDLKQLYINTKNVDNKSRNIIGLTHWVIIYKAIGLAGNIKWYYSARNIAKEIAHENFNKYKNAHNVLALYSVRAQTEDRVKPKIENLINPANYEIAIAYSRLYENKKDLFIKEISKYDSEKDLLYRNALCGKRVAIVGPIETSFNNGEEIDSFDFVIRLNAIDLNFYDIKKFGRNTNAISFVREVLVTQYNKILKNLTEDQFIFFNSYINDPFKEKTKNQKNIRQTLDLSNRRNNIFFSGYATHIQRAIMDCIRFQPSEIKIFNTNLWINMQPSNHYHYQHCFDSTILILHDIFSNFEFTKRMHENKIISADQALQKILEMSTDEYCSAMHKNYTHSGL